jgi:hypothetical protein
LEQRIKLARTIKRIEIVAPANMGGANENLRN